MSRAGSPPAAPQRRALARGLVMTGLAIGLALQICAAHAHDAIGSDARKSYLARLDELHRLTLSIADVATRAKAQFQIGRTLDEIRDLLNQDLISHGKTQGLETMLLIRQLSGSATPLRVSARTGRYAANLQHYRAALALDGRGSFATTARFLIFKEQFYDSFTDDPLKPVGQTDEDLREMIALGEGLLRAQDDSTDREELAFLLALRYLQAERAGLLPRAEARHRFAALLDDFRRSHPQSLKLATLQALSQ
jgi:hypothetical protein